MTTIEFAVKALQRLERTYDQALGIAVLRAKGVILEGHVVLYGCPIITSFARGSITLGRNVVLCSRSSRTALGIAHPVVLRTLAEGASIRIGSDVGMSGGSICASSTVAIGDGCLIGADVTIADTDFHPVATHARRYSRSAPTTAPIHIGPNVFIGASTIILKGVTVGANSVIGAGSVVTRSIPPDVVAAGNPCRVLRPLFE